MSILEIASAFTLFMIFVVSSHFVVPVVRTLVCIYELCFRGVMGQVMYVLDILLWFHGVLYLFSAKRRVRLLRIYLWKFRELLYYASGKLSIRLHILTQWNHHCIARGVFSQNISRFSICFNPPLKSCSCRYEPQRFANFTKSSSNRAVGGALIANTFNSAVNAYTADNALNSNNEIVRQASHALEKGKIDGSQYLGRRNCSFNCPKQCSYRQKIIVIRI